MEIEKDLVGVKYLFGTCRTALAEHTNRLETYSCLCHECLLLTFKWVGVKRLEDTLMDGGACVLYVHLSFTMVGWGAMDNVLRTAVSSPSKGTWGKL